MVKIILIITLTLASCNTPRELMDANLDDLIETAGGTKMSDQWFGPPADSGITSEYAWRRYKNRVILYEIGPAGKVRNAFSYTDSVR